MNRTTESLARVKLFADLEEEDIRRLDTRCTWQRYNEKELIAGYRDLDDHVFFLVRGRVRAHVQLPSGKESIFQDYGDGESFAELAAIDGKPRMASFMAISPSVVAKMPGPLFCECLRKYPEVGFRMLIRFCDQVRALSHRVTEYGALNVKSRIFAEILRLSRPRAGAENVAVISPPPYHHEIAARVSTRREAVARELKAAERAGLLSRSRGALVLEDVAALQRLVDDAAQETG